MNRQSEIERAILCRQTSPNMTVQELASYYNIERTVLHEVFGDTQKSAPSAHGRTQKRRGNRTEQALKWAAGHVGETMNPDTLATVLECSSATARRIMDTRPDVFRKIRWGTWEVRDPQQDRKAEKEGNNADH